MRAHRLWFGGPGWPAKELRAGIHDGVVFVTYARVIEEVVFVYLPIYFVLWVCYLFTIT